MGTSYLLPMDRRLLPFSFRLLLVDARRKVTLWGGQGGVGQCCPLCYPVLDRVKPLLLAPPPLTPGPRTFGASSYPGRWSGWLARVGWHHGCHLLGKREGNSLCGSLPAFFSCQCEVVEIILP